MNSDMTKRSNSGSVRMKKQIWSQSVMKVMMGYSMISPKALNISTITRRNK
jgi:hypothetical protein